MSTNLKAAVRNVLFKMYHIYIISEYTMDPCSNPYVWLVLINYGTLIISVYILTILDWFE